MLPLCCLLWSCNDIDPGLQCYHNNEILRDTPPAGYQYKKQSILKLLILISCFCWSYSMLKSSQLVLKALRLSHETVKSESKSSFAPSDWILAVLETPADDHDDHGEDDNEDNDQDNLAEPHPLAKHKDFRGQKIFEEIPNNDVECWQVLNKKLCETCVVMRRKYPGWGLRQYL